MALSPRDTDSVYSRKSTVTQPAPPPRPSDAYRHRRNHHTDSGGSGRHVFTTYCCGLLPELRFLLHTTAILIGFIMLFSFVSGVLYVASRTDNEIAAGAQCMRNALHLSNADDAAQLLYTVDMLRRISICVVCLVLLVRYTLFGGMRMFAIVLLVAITAVYRDALPDGTASALALAVARAATIAGHIYQGVVTVGGAGGTLAALHFCV